MIVPIVTLSDTANIAEVRTILEDMPAHKIACANWTDYNHYPEASFKIAHNSKNILLQFEVKENEIKAMAKGNHSPVCRDSCVEFFIAFGESDYYYNLELSCIGEMLLGYRKERKNAAYASDQIIESIRRESTLGNKNFELQKGDFHWILTAIIPASSFWGGEIERFDGQKARANFYKCGDELSAPHYLSWLPVDIEKPNFHNVDFFGDITFE